MNPSHQNMPSSKQTRILIWRDEVASASDVSSPTRTLSAPSLASTSTNNTTTTATSSAAAAAIARISSSPPPPVLPSSRGRRLWRRLSRHLPGRLGAVKDDPLDNLLVPPEELPHEDDEPIRTSMYRPLDQETRMAYSGQMDGGAIDDVEEALDHPDGRSGDGGCPIPGRGLLETQDRLQRAARLLEQHAAKQDERKATGVA